MMTTVCHDPLGTLLTNSCAVETFPEIGRHFTGGSGRTSPMTSATNLISQVVVRYPDSTYKVRTYRLVNGRWVLASENPANMRDITQATLDGRVADAEVAG